MRQYHRKGSYGGEINFLEIIGVLQGSCSEIQRLQNDLNTTKNEMNQIEKEINSLKESLNKLEV
jgi:chromosome segregation ATPase